MVISAVCQEFPHPNLIVETSCKKDIKFFMTLLYGVKFAFCCLAQSCQSELPLTNVY